MITYRIGQTVIGTKGIRQGQIGVVISQPQMLNAYVRVKFSTSVNSVLKRMDFIQPYDTDLEMDTGL